MTPEFVAVPCFWHLQTLDLVTTSTCHTLQWWQQQSTTIPPTLCYCVFCKTRNRNSKYSDSSNFPPHSHLRHARTKDQRHARQGTEKPLVSPQAVSVSILPVWTHSSKCQCGQHSMSWESQSEFPFMWENRVRFTEHTILKQIATTITLQQEWSMYVHLYIHHVHVCIYIQSAQSKIK